MAERDRIEPRETTPNTHMASAPSYLDSEPPPNTPRWVKLFGIGLILFILLLVIVHLAGGGPMSHIR